MGKKLLLQLLNVLGLVMVLGTNYAANAVPLNNLTTGEVSDFYPNLFTPAGVTFAIWGLIYILLLGFCLYQIRDWFTSRQKEMPYLYAIGYLFFVSCLLNSAWIFAWHYLQPFLSLLIIVALLLVLIKIYLNLRVGKEAVVFSFSSLHPPGEGGDLSASEGPSTEFSSKVTPASPKASPAVSFWEMLLVQLPFRLYLGWIIVATLANTTALLVHLEWDGWGMSEAFWTLVLIGAATIITLAFLKLHRDLAVAMVSLWALLGIIIKRLETDPVVWPVVIGAMAAMVIIAVVAAFNYPRAWKRYLSS